MVHIIQKQPGNSNTVEFAESFYRKWYDAGVEQLDDETGVVFEMMVEYAKSFAQAEGREEVIAFISTIRESFIGSEMVYTNGSCYQLYKILKLVFPAANAYYNSDHVITEINGKFYDITGEVEKTNHLEMEEHYPDCSVKQNRCDSVSPEIKEFVRQAAEVYKTNYILRQLLKGAVVGIDADWYKKAKHILDGTNEGKQDIEKFIEQRFPGQEYHKLDFLPPSKEQPAGKYKHVAICNCLGEEHESGCLYNAKNSLPEGVEEAAEKVLDDIIADIVYRFSWGRFLNDRMMTEEATQILKEKLAGASWDAGKKDAVEFAEWARDFYTPVLNTDVWVGWMKSIKGFNKGDAPDITIYSTEELYTLFTKSKTP